MNTQTKSPTLAEWAEATLTTKRLAEEIADSVDKYDSKIDRLSSEIATLQNDLHTSTQRAHLVQHEISGVRERIEELTPLAKRHYTQHVLDPIAHRLISMLDILESVSTPDTPREFLVGLAEQIHELVQQLGVDSLQSNPGSRFDPKRMKPSRSVPTTEEGNQERIAASDRPGYRRAAYLLRPETVQVYRYVEPQSQSIASPKEGHE